MTSVATFDVPCGFDLQRESARRATATPLDTNSQQARQINEREVRRYRLSASATNSAVLLRLRDLWERTVGGVLTMTYTPPGESAIEVRFAEPPRVSRASATAADLEVVLEEVL